MMPGVAGSNLVVHPTECRKIWYSARFGALRVRVPPFRFLGEFHVGCAWHDFLDSSTSVSGGRVYFHDPIKQRTFSVLSVGHEGKDFHLSVLVVVVLHEEISWLRCVRV